MHLNARGDQRVAEIIDAALFAGRGLPGSDPARLEQIRQAVLDKNFYWFNRYRTTDGYSIFGGRADLKFVNGQTNREVMQREMEVLDVMTANRDRRIWAVAEGGHAHGRRQQHARRSFEVNTNKPGPLPGGKHVFLGGEEAIAKMTVGKGLKVNLFASDEAMFPELVNPVQMAFDTKGRLWVAGLAKLSALEAQGGDERQAADPGRHRRRRPGRQVHHVCRPLHNPTGFEFWGGGVLVAMAPDLLFLKDTDGDDKADVRERVISGLDSADTHHTSNSFTLDPGGALYFQEGHVPPFAGRNALWPSRAAGQCRRVSLRAAHAEVRASTSAYGFANPHGHAFDGWGQDIVADGTGANAVPRGVVLRPHATFPTSIRGPPHGLQAADPPLPGHRVSLQPPLSRRDAGQPAGRQRDRLPGHSALQDRRQGCQLRRHRAGADPLVERSELPAGRSRDRSRRRICTSPIGRTRSSATCSTTFAIRAATARTAASIA